MNKKPSSLLAAVAAGGHPLQPPPGFTVVTATDTTPGLSIGFNGHAFL